MQFIREALGLKGLLDGREPRRVLIKDVDGRKILELGHRALLRSALLLPIRNHLGGGD
jgi:hypothetical protein